jgi:DNA topoisomerase VI subunit B
VERKGQIVNTLENYIYVATKQGIWMNEALTDTYNPIFDILIKANSNTHNPQHTTQPIPEPSTPSAPHPRTVSYKL